jgi:hypothetical protein
MAALLLGYLPGSLEQPELKTIFLERTNTAFWELRYIIERTHAKDRQG